MKSRRRILCVFPRYARSFGTFHHAYPLFPRVKNLMPSQGLLVVAASLPPEWEARFVDENVSPATDSDFAWAEAVFVTGMHVQRRAIGEINDRAHQFGKLTVLGGPSVSGCAEWYPEFDILHVGELGDATQALYERLDATVDRPSAQIRLTTSNRTPLTAFPTPAYHLLDLENYLLANVQYSSGCPYRCEFCDIPALYGRNPRLKTPGQVVAELDAILRAGTTRAVYFVDDNFVGNPKAALDLLPHLIAWQRRTGYRIRFGCEATLNIAQNRELLELMREAAFYVVFLGIETPDEASLRGMVKEQNLCMPIVEAVDRLNSYGIEVFGGIILGLDQDTPTTGAQVLAFIEASNIPMLTINLLAALPKTPLWHRLEKDGRLLSDGTGGESNIRFLLPPETVKQNWLTCITAAYAPQAIYRRFAHQMRRTYPFRFRPARRHLVAGDLVYGLEILRRVLWRVGVRSDYRRTFWRFAIPALLRGNVEAVIHVGTFVHHFVHFARDCDAGLGENSLYSVNPIAEDAASLRPETSLPAAASLRA